MPVIVQSISSNYASTEEVSAAFELAKMDYFRALIEPPPGEGPTRGVVTFKGEKYAFRDNVGGTACVMYHATPSGWVAVTTPALLPGGNYKFVAGNFGGSTGQFVLIGVDGVNKAFKFDGTTLTQLTTGMPTDNPCAAEILPSQVLVLGFDNGSLMTSKVSDPTDFTVGGGGSEIAVGDSVRGLQLQPNKTLAIFCRKGVHILYGSVRADFQLTTLDKTLVTKPDTVQPLGDSIFQTQNGVNRLSRVQEFGDFQATSISLKVKPLLDRYQGRGATSYVVKSKGQYRLCMDDGMCIAFTFAGSEVSGASTLSYGLPVLCPFTGSDADGGEEIYFGSEDGMVYRAEKGNSFDGEPIRATQRPAFDFMQAPEHNKRFKKVLLEVEVPRRVALNLLPEMDYSGDLVHSSLETTALGGGGYYDDAVWNEVYWSVAAVSFVEMYLEGVGRNVSVVVFSNSATDPPHTINSMLIHWTPRGRRR